MLRRNRRMKSQTPLYPVGQTVRERGRTSITTVSAIDDTTIVRWYLCTNGMQYEESRLIDVTAEEYEWLTKINERERR